MIKLNKLNPCPGMLFPKEDDMYEECEGCLRRKVQNGMPPIKPPLIIALWPEYGVHE
jgi:hypothetical protein